MTDRLVWERDGTHWPHRSASRFVLADGLRWHVQEFAPGPRDSPPTGATVTARNTAPPNALLIHGTGAATHSWRGVAPLLAAHFRVLTLDLPGHGFTDMPGDGPNSRQFSLPGMAVAVRVLLQELGISPALVIGHSAGAALGVRLCLDGLESPRLVLGINAALLPLGGLAGQVFSPVAKLMAVAPFVPQMFSRRAANPAVLQRLIDGTGSTLDPQGLALYGQLVRNPGHAAGALAMMANWGLPQLARDMPRLTTPLHLLVGTNDRTISPRQADEVRTMLPLSTPSSVTALAGLGHLAHEERPDWVADWVLARWQAIQAR